MPAALTRAAVLVIAGCFVRPSIGGCRMNYWCSPDVFQFRDCSRRLPQANNRARFRPTKQRTKHSLLNKGVRGLRPACFLKSSLTTKRDDGASRRQAPQEKRNGPAETRLAWPIRPSSWLAKAKLCKSFPGKLPYDGTVCTECQRKIAVRGSRAESFFTSCYVVAMSTTILGTIIEPFAECLTRASAQKIVAIRADATTQALVDALADKANRGTLTDDERSEYDRILAAFHFVTIMQARARRLLN